MKEIYRAVLIIFVGVHSAFAATDCESSKQLLLEKINKMGFEEASKFQETIDIFMGNLSRAEKRSLKIGNLTKRSALEIFSRFSECYSPWGWKTCRIGNNKYATLVNLDPNEEKFSVSINPTAASLEKAWIEDGLYIIENGARMQNSGLKTEVDSLNNVIEDLFPGSGFRIYGLVKYYSNSMRIENRVWGDGFLYERHRKDYWHLNPTDFVEAVAERSRNCIIP